MKKSTRLPESKNIPYVKEYNSLGECTNPITKENPYLHPTYQDTDELGKPITLPYPNNFERRRMLSNR